MTIYQVRVVGYTGSRSGITEEQRVVLKKILSWIKPVEVHHGMFIGGDKAFHEIVREILPECKIVGHPTKEKRLMAQVVCDEYWLDKGRLRCDKDVVNCSTILIGSPRDTIYNIDKARGITQKKGNPYRSGTWYTIGYALSLGKEVIVIYPDGKMERAEARNEQH